MTSMEEAIAAGDGTLHGALDHWQEKHVKLLAALREYQDGYGSLRCPQLDRILAENT